jgi:hypothetical protein
MNRELFPKENCGVVLEVKIGVGQQTNSVQLQQPVSLMK